MRFIQTHSMGSDCTAPYDVKDYKAKTVQEFIQEMLKERPNEWGKIQVKMMFGGGFCTYRNGRLLSDLRPEFLDIEIQEVKSAGGWGCMDYLIFTKDKESTMKRTEDGHFIDDPMDIINSKPDFSGIGLRKTHIDEVTHFFVQRKGKNDYTLMADFWGFMPNIGVAQTITINGTIYRFACMEINIDAIGGFIFQKVLLKEE
jgi:hypothetical protein